MYAHSRNLRGDSTREEAPPSVADARPVLYRRRQPNGGGLLAKGCVSLKWDFMKVIVHYYSRYVPCIFLSGARTRTCVCQKSSDAEGYRIAQGRKAILIFKDASQSYGVHDVWLCRETKLQSVC